MITNKKNAWRSCNSSKEETLENRKTRRSVMGAFVFIILCQSASCSSADIYQWSSERSLLAVSSHFPDGKSASRGQTACQRMAGNDWFVASAGQKRELSGVSISSPKTIFPSSSRPNSNLVSAMMMPLLKA